MNSLFRKLFISGDWQMAYRVVDQRWPFNYDKPFIPIPNQKKYWYADPLLYESNGKVYLFCEAFNEKEQKGELAVMEYGDGKWSSPEVIIANNYHMSYPCVFDYQGCIYLIPESAESGSLEMYVADKFPYSWKKKCDLIPKANFADPTVFQIGEELYLFAWDESNSSYIGRIFQLDVRRQSCSEVSHIQYHTNTGRPAGFFFHNGEVLMRPSQNSDGMYGKSIIWNEVRQAGNVFVEEKVSEIDCSRVIIEGVKGEKRIHTYSSCSKIEIIDFCEFKFDLFKRIRILNRKYKVARRNKNR